MKTIEQDYYQLYVTTGDKSRFMQQMFERYDCSVIYAHQVYEWSRAWHGEDTGTRFSQCLKVWREHRDEYSTKVVELGVGINRAIADKQLKVIQRFAGQTQVTELRKIYLKWLETRDHSTFKVEYGAPNASWMVNSFKAIAGVSTATTSYKLAWDLVVKCGKIITYQEREQLIADVAMVGFTIKHAKVVISRFQTIAGIKTNLYRCRESTIDSQCRELYNQNRGCTNQQLLQVFKKAGIADPTARIFIKAITSI